MKLREALVQCWECGTVAVVRKITYCECGGRVEVLQTIEDRGNGKVSDE